MTKNKKNTIVSIIGLGLMGGSFGLALQEKFKENIEIWGWDNNTTHLDKALAKKLIQKKCDSLGHALQMSDIIYITIPVNYIISELRGMLDSLRDHQTIIDFGSTKEMICQSIETHPRRSQFIAAHPIAGTEYSGPDAAFSTLYQNTNMIICDKEKTDPIHLEKFVSHCEALNIKIIYFDSNTHDILLGYISHLSHAIAFALSNTVLGHEKKTHILQLAGSGFKSTVRLAKSEASTWIPIFETNKKNLLESIDRYKIELNKMYSYIENNKSKEIKEYIQNANFIKEILK